MRLHELSDNKGARKERTRVGRGIGSGKGKTGGRGVKGQKSRSGVSGIRAYEGGQMPLYMRLPKRGFNKPNRLKFVEVNLGRLQAAVDAGKLDAGQPVTIQALVTAGVARRPLDGLRILGAGADSLKAKLNVEAVHVTASATEAIEKAGGSVKTVEPSAKAVPSNDGEGFIDAIDLVVLIDGIGPKTEEALKAEGVEKLTQLVGMAQDARTALFEKLGVSEQAENEQWVKQAEEMIAGGAPRAKVDQDLVKKLRKKAK